MGFHPEVDVLLMFVDVDTLDAERKVEMAGFEAIKGEEGREEEENPWQRFAKRPTQHKRKPIRSTIDIVFVIILTFLYIKERLVPSNLMRSSNPVFAFVVVRGVNRRTSHFPAH